MYVLSKEKEYHALQSSFKKSNEMTENSGFTSFNEVSPRKDQNPTEEESEKNSFNYESSGEVAEENFDSPNRKDRTSRDE